jgi:hypothetical protein
MEDRRLNNNIPNFIIGINEGMASMSLRYANLILCSKQNLYRLVAEEGWYLSRLQSRCCTSRYLFDIMNGSVFRMKTSDVKPCLVERIRLSKIDIIAHIVSKLIKDCKLGFGPENLPDRDWLLNVLHTLEPSNDIFTGNKSIEKVVEIPLKYYSY